MAFNRFMTRTPMQFSFYKEPLDVLSNALQIRQQTYDKNVALADQLLSMGINSLDQDRANANAITRGYQDTVDKLSEQYQGDYAKMGRELMGLARKVRKDFTSGGEAFAYEYNKNLYDKWLDFSQKASLSPRGPSVNQVNLGSQHILGTYKGAGYNKETGTFGSLQTPQLVEYQEMSELVDGFAKNVVPNKVASGEWEISTGKVWYKNKVGIQEVTPERIQKAVEEGMNSHQGWNAYAKQMEQFGAPITQEMYTSQINRAVNSFAYRWREQDQDIQVNPFALEDYKNQDETSMQPMTGYYTPARSVGQPTNQQQNEGARGIPTSFDRSEYKAPLISVEPTTVWGRPSFKPKISLNSDAQSFDAFMKRPDIQTKYGAFGNNLYSSLSKDPEWKNLSEQDKARRYDDAYTKGQAEFRRTQDFVYTLNQPTMDALTETFVRQGFPAGAKFSVIDHKGETTLSDLTLKELQTNTKWRGMGLNMIQEKGYVQGITNPGSGLPFGLELSFPEAKDSKQKQYRVVMQGYDAKAEETGRNLQRLYYPYYGGTSESPWVPMSSTYPYMVKTEVIPQFDTKGSYLGTKENVLFQRMQLDPDTGRPMVDENNQVLTEGDVLNSGKTLQEITDSEFRMSGLDYQSNKRKDSKF